MPNNIQTKITTINKRKENAQHRDKQKNKNVPRKEIGGERKCVNLREYQAQLLL
jgi:hypothetical protein